MGTPLVTAGTPVVKVRNVGAIDADDNPNLNIGFLKELTPSDEMGSIDASAIGDAIATSQAGLRKVSFSGSGLWSPDDDGQTLLRTNYAARTDTVLTVLHNPAGASMSKGYEYICKVMSFTPKFASSGETTFDLKLEVSSTTVTAV